MFAEAHVEPSAGTSFRAPVVEKINPVPEIAAKVVMKTNGDTSEGATMLLKELKSKHRTFYNQKAQEAMSCWAQDQIRSARTRLRSQIANAPRGVSAPMQQGVSAESLRRVAEMWMDWPVLPGVPLREATREQINKAATMYRLNAETYGKRGRWLTAIAEVMPDDESTVADVLDEKAVSKMASQFGVSAV